ncbi:MAG: ATP-binding protein [Actinobacteria bacterium]|nr:ATP-binding protein [Actinomycetota bacterium]
MRDAGTSSTTARRAATPPSRSEPVEVVFEPLAGAAVRLHSPGVGIGLSLVLRLAELHGGRAWVQDRPGGGASFRVYLPDVPQNAPSMTPDAEPQSAAAAPGG